MIDSFTVAVNSASTVSLRHNKNGSINLEVTPQKSDAPIAQRLEGSPRTLFGSNGDSNSNGGGDGSDNSEEDNEGSDTLSDNNSLSSDEDATTDATTDARPLLQTNNSPASSPPTITGVNIIDEPIKEDTIKEEIEEDATDSWINSAKKFCASIGALVYVFMWDLAVKVKDFVVWIISSVLDLAWSFVTTRINKLASSINGIKVKDFVFWILSSALDLVWSFVTASGTKLKANIPGLLLGTKYFVTTSVTELASFGYWLSNLSGADFVDWVREGVRGERGLVMQYLFSCCVFVFVLFVGLPSTVLVGSVAILPTSWIYPDLFSDGTVGALLNLGLISSTLILFSDLLLGSAIVTLLSVAAFAEWSKEWLRGKRGRVVQFLSFVFVYFVGVYILWRVIVIVGWVVTVPVKVLLDLPEIYAEALVKSN